MVIFGDLENARAINSLKQILSLYPVDIVEIDIFKKENRSLEDYSNIFKKADVVYITRLQKEYHSLQSTKFPKHQFTEKTLSLLKEDAIILHPGPVLEEIKREVRNDPRWVYKQQIKNGLYVRMDLFRSILGW